MCLLVVDREVHLSVKRTHERERRITRTLGADFVTSEGNLSEEKHKIPASWRIQTDLLLSIYAQSSHWITRSKRPSRTVLSVQKSSPLFHTRPANGAKKKQALSTVRRQ